MNFYNKYILPKYLNFTMAKKEAEEQRPAVIGEARGIVLEIGFGSGLNLPYYKNVTKLYALDPSVGLYKLARERIKGAAFPVEYIQASAEQIPLGDSTVDMAVSTWSLCSIPSPEIALKEIFRVLKPGGKFIFIEHGKSPRNFFAKLQDLLTPVSRCVAGGCHMNREMERLIREAGFDMQTLEKFQGKTSPLDFIYKGVAVRRNFLPEI